MCPGGHRNSNSKLQFEQQEHWNRTSVILSGVSEINHDAFVFLDNQKDLARIVLLVKFANNINISLYPSSMHVKIIKVKLLKSSLDTVDTDTYFLKSVAPTARAVAQLRNLKQYFEQKKSCVELLKLYRYDEFSYLSRSHISQLFL